jgi:uncharacterized protein YegJ (DUF2314 family)
MKFLIIPVVLVVAVFIWWRFFYIARPTIPPLSILDDDPLMSDAITKAKDTIPYFRELAAQPNRGMRVKIPFVSSSGTTEYLWSEVLSFRDSQIEVRYLTPPVTHTGRLERLHTHPVSDLVDWQVELESGKYAGGYTMHVMFLRGREQSGSLPPELEAEEKKHE